MLKRVLAIALAVAATGSMAAAITPTYTTFGNLAGATWGGSGIPTDPSAIAQTLGSPEGTAGAIFQSPLTIAMIAHQRFSNPALTNNGAGRYGATAGIDTNAPSPANPYATWNFGFYLSGKLALQNYTLFYDFDPASSTDENVHGRIDILGASLGNLALMQDSWNLGMDFLDIAQPGVTPPAFASFDPNAVGEYTFALVAFDPNTSTELGRAAIAVDVRAGVVPEPSSLALVALALVGAAGVGRRRV